MHNGMYPGFARLQPRAPSPNFADFSPLPEFAHVEANIPQNSHLTQADIGHSPIPQHLNSISMRPSRQVTNKLKLSSGHMNSNSIGMKDEIGHHRGDFMLPDSVKTLNMCTPIPVSNCLDNGINSELLLMTGNGEQLCETENFAERHRRGHGQRSNHKIDAEHQVKWSRRNIAATMERFEPTQTARCSSSSTSSLEYGFTASVVASGLQPSHPSQISSATQLLPNGADSSSMFGPHNHVYSYAYYEPGAAKCHTNVPNKDGSALDESTLQPIHATAGSLKNVPRNSIRSLLAKSFRSKSNSGQSSSCSPSVEDRHTYTTRYGTTENLYEEVNEQKIRKVLSDNRIAMSAASNVKEELRRVQHNHFRVLDELNLSLEALIMPPSPLDVSPKSLDDTEEVLGATATSGIVRPANTPTSTVSAAASSQRPRRCGLLGGDSSSLSTSSQPGTLSQISLDNLSTTLNLMELKEHSHNSCTNTEFDEGDLDSGFSGSGSSSGASYNESLRCYKTGTLGVESRNQILPGTLSSYRSPTAFGTSTSKSSMVSQDDPGLSNCGGAASLVSTSAAQLSTFDFARGCSDTNNSSMRSASASSSSSATGAKPKRSFWTIKP